MEKMNLNWLLRLYLNKSQEGEEIAMQIVSVM